MITERELLHPLEDEQLDLGDLAQRDERVRCHGTGTRSRTSSMTMSTVTPWLAACGPEPDAVTQHVLRQVLHVLWIHLRSAAEQQRPHLHEPSPADRGARGRAQVDAPFDELGRRAIVPRRFGVVRTRRPHEAPDVLGERFVQEHLAGDHAAELDDPLLRHERVEPHLLEVEAHQPLFLFGRADRAR